MSLTRKVYYRTELKRILADKETPLGLRLRDVREIIDAAQEAERQLLMQLGADLAKYMAANGFEPTGRTVGDALKERDAAMSRAESGEVE